MMGIPYARNPVLTRGGVYPFQRLTHARQVLAARANVPPLVDFGTGEPREPTPAFVREALVAAVRAETVSGYPLAVGIEDLRIAVAAWVHRRFGVTLDPDRHVLPTLGSKEAIFGVAQVLVDRPGGRDLIAVPQPAYPVYERGARFAGADVLGLPLRAANGFLPDLDAIRPEQWARLALVWVNYPNNPTAAVASRAWYRDAVRRCRDHGVVLASDEAYSELWFTGDPPDSALQVDEHGDALRGLLAFNTLSKRSSMPGYRSGFVAGDAELIAALKQYRPSVGTAPQWFVQRAAVAAWGDERHVEEVRERYRAKLRVLQSGLDALGLADAGGPASFFRWLALPKRWSEAAWAREARADPATAELVRILTDGHPDDDGSAAFSAGLLRHGVVVAPGAFFGPEGEGYVRVALVPEPEACAVAARRLVALADG